MFFDAESDCYWHLCGKFLGRKVIYVYIQLYNRLIAMKANPYICGTKKCIFCLCEKLMIARANSASLLNKHD